MALRLAKVDTGMGDNRSMASGMYAYSPRQVDFATDQEERGGERSGEESLSRRSGLRVHYDSPIAHASDDMGGDDDDDDVSSDTDDGDGTTDEMYVGPEINRRQSMVSSARPPPYPGQGVRRRGPLRASGEERVDSARQHHANNESHTDSHDNVDLHANSDDGDYADCPSPQSDGVPTIQVSL
jgi:hypothetical protein